MLIFEISNEDVVFLNELQNKYSENVVVAKSKNFSGTMELFDVIIVLTPTILSTVAIVINNILQHRISKMELNKNQPSEVILKLKNDRDEYEILLKSSTISSTDEIKGVLDDAIKRIKVLQGYE